MKRYVVANWKLNPTTYKQAQNLLEGYTGLPDKNSVTVVVCPPPVWLPLLSTQTKDKSNHKWGAQDCFWESAGSYTGAFSPTQLKNIGVDYVIIGHSEQRQYFGLDDVKVNKKIKSARKARLVPIICVGGGPDVKKHDDVNQLLRHQLGKGLEGVRIKPGEQDILFAYEPAWAIGTGKPASAKHAAEAAFYIRWWLQKNLSQTVAEHTPILYGGSVNSKNSGLLLKKSNLNGFLVGGASLNPAEFIKIVEQSISI